MDIAKRFKRIVRNHLNLQTQYCCRLVFKGKRDFASVALINKQQVYTVSINIPCNTRKIQVGSTFLVQHTVVQLLSIEK